MVLQSHSNKSKTSKIGKYLLQPSYASARAEENLPKSVRKGGNVNDW